MTLTINFVWIYILPHILTVSYDKSKWYVKMLMNQNLILAYRWKDFLIVGCRENQKDIYQSI